MDGVLFANKFVLNSSWGYLISHPCPERGWLSEEHGWLLEVREHGGLMFIETSDMHSYFFFFVRVLWHSLSHLCL